MISRYHYLKQIFLSVHSLIGVSQLSNRTREIGDLTSNLVPRAFPLKSGWGARPTHFFKGKALGRGCLVSFKLAIS